MVRSADGEGNGEKASKGEVVKAWVICNNLAGEMGPVA